MKRSISSMLVLAMVAALLSIFAGVASAADPDQGMAQLQAVNGTSEKVTVTATNGTDTVELGKNIDSAGVGAPAIVAPGEWTVDFGDGNSYKLTVGPVEAWVVASGYGDPADTNANGAMAYEVNLDETNLPAVVVANSADVAVKVTPGDIDVDPGKMSARMDKDAYTLTTPGGSSVSPDISGVEDTSYTTIVAVGDDTLLDAAVVTIPDVAKLKESLAPAPGEIAVPDVVDMPQDDATAAIEGAGLTVGDVTQAPDDTIVAGNVISQDPAAGTQVAAGEAVDLVVSTGPDSSTVAVPDVAGKTADEGRADLEAAGFKVESRDEQSDTVDAGLIIETEPAAGTEATAGDTVTMVVSSGAEEGVVVPDLIGLSQKDATEKAEAADLTVRFVEDPDNPDPDAVVAGQNPASGETAAPGSEIVAQLAPKVDDAWVIVTLSTQRVLTVSGINFQPGSTVTISVVDTDTSVTATVQSDGSWTTSADLSNVDNDEAMLLVEGTAADGSAYSETFKIPAAGESTTEPTTETTDSGAPFWLWIVLGLIVLAAIGIGVKAFGGGSSDGGDTPDGGTPPTDTAPPSDTPTGSNG